MKKSLIAVLLFGGLCFENVKAATELVTQDIFLFRVTNEVFSLNDLREQQQILKEFRCMYPSSLLLKTFSSLIRGELKGIFHVKNIKRPKYTKKQIRYFQNFLDMHSLKMYSKAHRVSVGDSLAKAFYLTGSRAKCQMTGFKANKQFRPILREIVRLELFLRSRFLPGEGTSTENVDYPKAIKSVRVLTKSIKKQVEREVYWE